MHITGSTIHPEKSTADILGSKVEEAHTSAYVCTSARDQTKDSL